MVTKAFLMATLGLTGSLSRTVTSSCNEKCQINPFYTYKYAVFMNQYQIFSSQAFIVRLMFGYLRYCEFPYPMSRIFIYLLRLLVIYTR